MRFQRFEDRYIIRLERGELLFESLLSFLADHGIRFSSLSAAGAVEWVRLGYWDRASHSYQYREFAEQLEVVSFEGNSSWKDDQPFLHIHGVFGRSDFSVFGGHIADARVYPTMEIWVRSESLTVQRTHDEATGLDLLDLPNGQPAAGTRVAPTR